MNDKTFKMTGGKGLLMQWGGYDDSDPKAMDWDLFEKNNKKNGINQGSKKALSKTPQKSKDEA